MPLLLIFLKLFFFLSNVAALGISVQPQTLAGQPSQVVWTWEPSDGANELTFDLRFVRPPDSEDVGLAFANILASPSIRYGSVQVVFPSPGSYELVAVTGPDATNLGTSNQVNAFSVPTISISPTSTCSPTPSATTSVHATTTAVSNSGTHKKNLGAIVGGTLGGVAFLGLLAALVFLCLRRRQPAAGSKRWTFHRDMMVRPRNPNEVTIVDVNPSPTISQSSSPPPFDIEQGSPHDTDPSEVVMIASANGLRPLFKPSSRPLPLPPIPQTDRQEAISKRIERTRNQIMELERNAGPTQHIMLDDLRKQLSWLQDQLRSAWAMGLTDVTPLGFSHNLAP